MRDLDNIEYPVLPVGPVSLKQGKEGANPDFGNVLEEFSHESDRFVVLVADDKAYNRPNTPVTHRIVSGFSTEESARSFGHDNPYTNRCEVSLAHDQTHKRIGEPGQKFVGVFPFTVDGLQAIRAEIKQRSVHMVVLK